MGDRLRDKVALITGAARGQGEAEARLFVNEGARVFIADLLTEEGRKLAAELGERAEFLELDVSDEGQWSRSTAHILDRAGRIDDRLRSQRRSRLALRPLCDFAEGARQVRGSGRDLWHRPTPKAG